VSSGHVDQGVHEAAADGCFAGSCGWSRRGFALALGAEFFLTHFLAIEPSVFGGYLNFSEPTTPDPNQPPAGPPFAIPGFSTGQRLSGWMLGFRIGLNLIVG